MVSEKKIDAVKSERSPFHTADIIVLAILVALALILTLTAFNGKGAKVVVTYNGVSAEYDINTDKEIDIDGKLTVCIENGSVYVKDATCPDKICESMGAVKKANQTIVCAPSGITVRITGGDSNRVVTG